MLGDEPVEASLQIIGQRVVSRAEISKLRLSSDRRDLEGIKLELLLSREELAELAGVAPETLIRLLGKFKREKLLMAKGREITLLNLDRLTKIAEPHS